MKNKLKKMGGLGVGSMGGDIPHEFFFEFFAFSKSSAGKW